MSMAFISCAVVRGTGAIPQLLRAELASQMLVETRRWRSRWGSHMSNRHRDPKWKLHRANQTVRVKLPDFEELREDITKRSPSEVRSMLKKRGIVPGRTWVEKPVFLASSSTVFEPYVAPEGDGKASFLSKSGSLQRMEQLSKKGQSLLQLRKIRQFDEDFEVAEFAEHAHRIYEDAHTALADREYKRLEKLVTERCYPEMLANTELKTLRWNLLKSLEPPRVVHLRTQDIISKDNIFAQVTVRLHTQQTLAIYDRFGNLLHGSEAMVKDVLEYVVFEKHMSNPYGLWRLHGKIIPEWQPVRSPQISTIVKDRQSDSNSTSSPASNPATSAPQDKQSQLTAA